MGSTAYKQTPRYKAWASAYARRRKGEDPKGTWARAVLNAARVRCKKTGTTFSLALSDLMALDMPALCPVLGCEINWAYKGTRGSRDNSPSLDRINNSKGYEPGNVRVISMRANRMKSDASGEERVLLALDSLRAYLDQWEPRIAAERATL